MNKAVDQAPFKMTRKIAAERRARIALIVESFPEADTVATGDHLSLFEIDMRTINPLLILAEKRQQERKARNCPR